MSMVRGARSVEKDGADHGAHACLALLRRVESRSKYGRQPATRQQRREMQAITAHSLAGWPSRAATAAAAAAAAAAATAVAASAADGCVRSRALLHTRLACRRDPLWCLDGRAVLEVREHHPVAHQGRTRAWHATHGDSQYGTMPSPHQPTGAD